MEPWMETQLNETLGFSSLLPVQEQIVPFAVKAIRSGIPFDICLSAPTGSGKTLCYLVPILQEAEWAHSKGEGTQLRAIILVPSRQLGWQVHQVASKLSSGRAFRVAILDKGGKSRDSGSVCRTVTLADGRTISLPVADVLISTPQQLLKQLMDETGERIPLGALKMLVIDEADEVLNGTFTNVAARVIAHHEARKQPDAVLHKMLCSATMTTHIAKVSEVSLRNATYFNLDNMGRATDEGTADAVTHRFTMPTRLFEHWVTVSASERHVVFLKVMRFIIKTLNESTGSGGTGEQKNKAVLVFCSTSDTVKVMCAFLRAAGLPALEFASAATEVERKRAVLEAFTGSATIVVATDALMRGIDLPGVGAVVMYDAPRTLQQYIHRTGRTARANCTGHSYALLTKYGPSGETQDGEITAFKQFSALLLRQNNVIHERQLQAVEDSHVEEANELLVAAKHALKELWAGGRRAQKRPRDDSVSTTRTAKSE